MPKTIARAVWQSVWINSLFEIRFACSLYVFNLGRKVAVREGRPSKHLCTISCAEADRSKTYPRKHPHRALVLCFRGPIALGAALALINCGEPLEPHVQSRHRAALSLVRL